MDGLTAAQGRERIETVGSVCARCAALPAVLLTLAQPRPTPTTVGALVSMGAIIGISIVGAWLATDDDSKEERP